jgi:hypothetical protein
MSLCKYCFHPRRDEIDRQYVAGTPLRTIIHSFGGSLGTASRHREHVKEIIQARTQEERAEHGSSLLDRVERLAAKAEKIVDIAEAEKNYRGATSALVAACKLLDLCGRVSGEIRSANAAGGSLHVSFTSNKVVNVHSFGDDDAEFATMIAEATNNFDPVVIERLKRIAQEQRSLPDCDNDVIQLPQRVES